MRSFSHPYTVPHDTAGQPVSVGTRLRRAFNKSVALAVLMHAEEEDDAVDTNTDDAIVEFVQVQRSHRV